MKAPIDNQPTTPVPSPAIIKIGNRLSLVFREPAPGNIDFPTSRIPKGLLVACDGRELAEEGLGFGVPLLKFGSEDVFPGDADFSLKRMGNSTILDLDYELNLVKKLNRNGRKIGNRSIYRLESWLGWLHRECPPLRRPGDWFFNHLRRILGIKSVFEKAASAGTVKVTYAVSDADKIIHLTVDLSGLNREGLTEIIIASEQGARFFNSYWDSSGVTLSGKKIGTWDEVIAVSASFVDPKNGITFTLRRIDNSKLFRGMESDPGRLDWSGFSYVLPPDTNRFAYDIVLGETA